MTAVADTSFVVALENKADKHRQSCLSLLESNQLIYLPQSVLNEVCYLLTRSGGNRATIDFLRRLPDLKFVIVTLTIEDFLRTADILEKYRDSRIDFVDASVVAVAERLNVTRILTLDQRDFHIVRPKHAPHFELLPQV